MYNTGGAWYIHWPVEMCARAIELGLPLAAVDAMYGNQQTVRTPTHNGRIDAIGRIASTAWAVWLEVEPVVDMNTRTLIVTGLTVITEADLAQVWAAAGR